MPNVKVSFSVPAWPQTGGSLLDAASGAYNSYYTSMAQVLVRNGEGHSILRYGWEFNGPWVRWYAGNSGDALNYAEAWRQFVTSVRSVVGSDFKFDWTISNNARTDYDLSLAYPGDEFVDFIGNDVYDWSYVNYTHTSFSDRWNDLLYGNGVGMDWQASFAVAHNKQISFPEWGESYRIDRGRQVGGGDDPDFITSMFAWFSTHWTAYENYFASDSPNTSNFHDLRDGLFPDSANQYRLEFEDNSQGHGNGQAHSTGRGYWLVASDGGVFSFGDASFYGSTSNLTLNRGIVGLAATPDGQGYWLVASDGGVFSFGDASFYGSTGGMKLHKPIVGLAATPDGQGYWLVASDGGVFSFGDASFYGSTGGMKLHKPIVGLTATPDGRGYWLVASDGGVFSFGDASFYGSTSNLTLNRGIVGLTATPDGRGYWLVASDGGVFSFGDASFYGSTSNLTLNRGIVGLAATPAGQGYWLVASDGGVFSFGDASFYGSTGGMKLHKPIVGTAPNS